ncbi:hypothetical protein H0H81_005312 [Sphagnurus paluster]|uniref:Nudix hydrolase domain-containing protein n=1 Tax=Sphagnurus paluster TaxID=117069 RepID=A0A9P7K6U1_9AGAR|nr:hypothetical protein H0H81_005312 [Sphagnurus paluster]
MTSSSSSSPEIMGANSQDRFSYKHATHDEVLEDLSSRFILNLPDDELSSLERICFQVEQAHWFYEDFIREENPKFPSLPLKKFSAMLFHACPLLHQWSHDHEQAFNTFMQYKTRVPVCGAIMLNDTWEKCLLVKGWKSSSGWGFPKGKINQVEPPANCAIREVLEETGYNLAGQLDPENVIEMSIREQKISLFIVPGVPEDYPFKTKTRKEISKIEWFRLTDLPTWKRNKAAAGRFYLISPFIGALKAFINERKPRGPRKAKKLSQIQNELPLSLVKDSAHDWGTQSSCIENRDPNPHSPLYSGSHVPQLTDHASLKNPDDAAMDPHFAHLLSALAISASANEKPPSPPSFSGKDPQPTENIGTPIVTPRADINTSSESDQHDWSASVPQHHRNPPVSSQFDDYVPDSTTPSCSLLPLPQPPQPPIFSNSVRDLEDPPMSRPSLVNYSPSPAPVTSNTAVFQSSMPVIPSREAVDRSKHIALLEAVSAESARLMEAYKAAAAHGVPVNVTDNFKSSLTSTSLPISSEILHTTSRSSGPGLPLNYPANDSALAPYGGLPTPSQNQESPLPLYYTPVIQNTQLPFYPSQFIPRHASVPFAPGPTYLPVQTPPPPNNTLLSILNSGRSASRISNVTPYPPATIG